MFLTAGVDYESRSGTLSFNSDNLVRIISINITDDSALEFNETFVVELDSNVTGVMVNPSSAMITIMDDDGEYWTFCHCEYVFCCELQHLKMHYIVIRSFNCTCTSMPTGVTVGFTVVEKSTMEAIGLVTLEVSVESGILQHSVDIGFKTVEINSENVATSEIP